MCAYNSREGEIAENIEELCYYEYGQEPTFGENYGIKGHRILLNLIEN